MAIRTTIALKYRRDNATDRRPASFYCEAGWIECATGRVRFASKARSGRKMAGEGVWNRGETVIVRYMVSTWIGTQIGN